MISLKNFFEQAKSEAKQSFRIRKFAVGAVSVLAATFYSGNSNITHASEVSEQNEMNQVSPTEVQQEPITRP